MLERCGSWMKSGHDSASADAGTRLQAYATLASAAVVGVSYADVTRTVIDEVGNSSFTFQAPTGALDIQRHFVTVGNGETSDQLSFVLWADQWSSAYGGSSLQEFYLGKRDASHEIRFQSGVSLGDVIGSSSGTPWLMFSSWREQSGGTADTGSATFTPTHSPSLDFPQDQSFLVGFTLGSPGSGAAEGWIEMTYDPDFVSVTIHDWYVGAAGEEVLAGVTAVPSLSALATLACGAAGLRRRRQRTVSKS